MTSRKIRWRGRVSTDGRFQVNADNVRGEGICYFLDLSAADHKIASRGGIETAFYGRGGIAKTKAAAQRIVDVGDART